MAVLLVDRKTKQTLLLIFDKDTKNYSNKYEAKIFGIYDYMEQYSLLEPGGYVYFPNVSFITDRDDFDDIINKAGVILFDQYNYLITFSQIGKIAGRYYTLMLDKSFPSKMELLNLTCADIELQVVSSKGWAENILFYISSCVKIIPSSYEPLSESIDEQVMPVVEIVDIQEVNEEEMIQYDCLTIESHFSTCHPDVKIDLNDLRVIKNQVLILSDGCVYCLELYNRIEIATGPCPPSKDHSDLLLCDQTLLSLYYQYSKVSTSSKQEKNDVCVSLEDNIKLIPFWCALQQRRGQKWMIKNNNVLTIPSWKDEVNEALLVQDKTIFPSYALYLKQVFIDAPSGIIIDSCIQ